MTGQDQKREGASSLDVDARITAANTLLSAKATEYGGLMLLGRYREAAELRDSIHTLLDVALDIAEEAYRKVRKQAGLDDASGNPKPRG